MGFWSDTVEVVGLQSIPLLEGNRVNPEGKDSYSIADESARNYTILNYPGMDNYRMQYMVGFRRKYRESFSAEYLDAQGFPIEVAPMKLLNESSFASWLAPQTNPPLSSIMSTSISALNPWTMSKKHLQDTYGHPKWSNQNNLLLDEELGFIGSGKKDWILTSAWYTGVSPNEKAKFKLEPTDGTDAVEIEISFYIQPPLKTVITQYVASGISSDWFLDFKNPDSLPDSVWSESEIEVSPVVPIKEDNVMHEDEKTVKNILEDLGVDGVNLWDQLILTCPPDYVPPEDKPNEDCDESTKVPSEIDNAYVMTGVSPMTDDAAAYVPLFLWFDEFAKLGSGTFSFSIQALRMTYDFSVYKTVHSGSIGRVFTATKEIVNQTLGSGTTGVWGPYDRYVMTLRYQRTKTEYDEIVVSNFEQTYEITRGSTPWQFSANLGWDPADPGQREAEPRLITTLDSYNNMYYDDWVPLHETGMVMVAFSYEKQKLKWYQTGIFKIVMIVIVTWFSGGFAGGFVQGLLNAAVNTMIAMAVGSLAMSIASMTDNSFLQMLVFVVAAVATMYASGFDFNQLSGFDGFYKMANTVVDGYNKAMNLSMMQETEEVQKEIYELKEKEAELDEKIRDMKGVNSALYIQDHNMDIASMTPGGLPTPDQYFNTQLGGELFNMNGLFDIDAVYQMKKNIKA